jgi:hypothetical protein
MPPRRMKRRYPVIRLKTPDFIPALLKASPGADTTPDMLKGKVFIDKLQLDT